MHEEEAPNPTNTQKPTNESANLQRLGDCEVCASTAAKYTCPRCEVKTCSLQCSSIHKKELECDGTRDKTKYIPLGKFTTLDMASDYRFLEEITRNVETLKKNLPLRRKQRFHGELPPHLYKLKCEAGNRKTTLKFLPQTFVKRKENSSRVKFNTRIISWHLEWVFPNCDNLKLCERQVAENEKLFNALSRILDQEDSVLQEKLQYYLSRDINGIRVFLKAEQHKGRKFYEMDLSASIKDNLRNKVVIEYPTFYVLLNEHGDDYDLIDSDVEEAGNKEENIINSIIRRHEKDDYLNKSMKNLMFTTEDSDCSE